MVTRSDVGTAGSTVPRLIDVLLFILWRCVAKKTYVLQATRAGVLLIYNCARAVKSGVRAPVDKCTFKLSTTSVE